MNVRIAENKKHWLVKLNGKIAAQFAKNLYTVTAARIYAAGLCIELGLR